ncbi:MAG TPA: heavy metal-responsive transcriptional regulator [Polyangia bacterium]|jgi:MerR family copper efflux transcriptional regulator|nr:heavy metal-responsive transcriptional regulator [Polyangia bacterium]
MRIGELARRVGVLVVTIRFYEAEGLLPVATRGDNGYRDFAASMVTRVRFIRRAQELGFTLGELRGFLAVSDLRAPLDGEVREHARRKLADLNARIGDLSRVRGALETLLRRRRCAPPEGPCPIVLALGEEPRQPSTRTMGSAKRGAESSEKPRNKYGSVASNSSNVGRPSSPRTKWTRA